jgi:hypothetical protein
MSAIVFVPGNVPVALRNMVGAPQMRDQTPADTLEMPCHAWVAPYSTWHRPAPSAILHVAQTCAISHTPRGTDLRHQPYSTWHRPAPSGGPHYKIPARTEAVSLFPTLSADTAFVVTLLASSSQDLKGQASNRILQARNCSRGPGHKRGRITDLAGALTQVQTEH